MVEVEVEQDGDVLYIPSSENDRVFKYLDGLRVQMTFLSDDDGQCSYQFPTVGTAENAKYLIEELME